MYIFTSFAELVGGAGTAVEDEAEGRFDEPEDPTTFRGTLQTPDWSS